MNLSHEVNKYIHREEELFDFLNKKGCSSHEISMFCVTAVFPVYVAYYLLYKRTNDEYYKLRCKSLCEFYKIEEEL